MLYLIYTIIIVGNGNLPLPPAVVPGALAVW